ncbi:MAG: SDR family NAD(P)-dependent oxidoreductase, partial [Acidimicrobiia bacterium]
MAVSDMQLSGFEGRVAAVTGAGKGIGRTIADALVAQGARTAYLDLVEPADLAVIEEESKTLFVNCDVSDEASVDEAFSTIEAAWGPVAILVNNAGIFRITAIEDTGVDEWNQMLSVNLTGAFLCSKRVLPGMREAG